MRRIVTLTAFAALFSALAFAESWSGTLVDSSCYSQQKKASSCAATNATTAFGVDVSGKVYNLDEAGNAKAAAALKNRADRSTDPNAQNAPITVKVTGTKDGDTIKVEMLEVQ